MSIDDYEAVYDLWIKCGNGLNNKDDSREGIGKYLNRNPNTSYVAVVSELGYDALLRQDWFLKTDIECYQLNSDNKLKAVKK